MKMKHGVVVSMFLLGWLTEVCVMVGQAYDSYIGWYWG